MVRLYFRLLGRQIQMDSVYFLRNLGACLLWMFADVFSQLASAISLFLLAVRFDGVGGMGAYEVLFMLGYVNCVMGLSGMLFGYNIMNVSRRIGRGQLDHMLIQPVPLPVQFLTGGVSPLSTCYGFLGGVGIMAVALHVLGFAVSPLWLGQLALSVLCTLLLVMALNFLISTAAFYSPVACEEISSHAFDVLVGLANYPLSGMPGAVQYALVTALPAGLIGWLPALLLLGKPPLSLPGWYLYAFAGLLAALATAVFRRGLAHYMRTGSFRYKAVGHRS